MGIVRIASQPPSGEHLERPYQNLDPMAITKVWPNQGLTERGLGQMAPRFGLGLLLALPYPFLGNWAHFLMFFFTLV